MMIILKNIKGAIFDMDGTLIDSLIYWNMLWDKFGKLYLNGKHFAPLPEDDKAIRTMTLEDATSHIHSVYGIGKNAEELFDVANKLIIQLYSVDVELKDGVLEFLEYCREKNVKMCIASATNIDLIKIAVRHCNIEKYFLDILSCADIGKGKDMPDIYLKALSSLGTSIDETCVFEDSHVAIATAAKIGLKTVGLYDRYNYGQDEIKRIANEYIAEGETLKKLIQV